MTRADQILATFSMTGGTGAYTGAFTLYNYRRTPAAALGNGVQSKFTVAACVSATDLTRTGDGEEFWGTVSTSGSGSISRDRLIASSTGSWINWANPTTCYVEGSQYAEDLTGTGPQFGDGSDGAITFDGSTTVLGLVPSGGVYTLTRNIYCTDITVNAGVTVKWSGYGIYHTGTLTNNGDINDNGGNGGNGSISGAGTGGTAAVGSRITIWGATSVTLTAGGDGGSRTSTTPQAGNSGGNVAAANNLAGAGGNGGASTSPGSGAGGSGGTVSAPASTLGRPRAVPFALTGQTGNTGWVGGGAGAGGGGVSQSSTGTVSGGGGGGPGGWGLISGVNIVNNGTIRVNGGNGGNGFCSGNANQAAGGGGSGPGGLLILVYGTYTGNAATANPGTVGVGATFGTGAVSAPTAGATGAVISIPAALNTVSTVGYVNNPVNLLVNSDFLRMPQQARATLTSYATAASGTSADQFATNWGVQHDTGGTNVQFRNWSQGDSSPPVAFNAGLGSSYLQLRNFSVVTGGIAICQFLEANGPDGLSAVSLQGQQVTVTVKAVAGVGTPTLKIAIREWQGTTDAPTRPVASWSGNVPTFQSTSYAGVGTGSGTLNTSTPTTVTATGTPTTSCVGLYVVVYVEGLPSGHSLYLSQASLTRGSTAPAVWQPHPSDEEMSARYCEASYVPGVAPGTSGDPRGMSTSPTPSSVANNALIGYVRYSVGKRSVPTVTLYNYTGTAGNFSDNSGFNMGVAAVSGNGTTGFSAQNGSGGSVSPTLGGCIFHWLSSARINPT